ncbi:MAG: hypothetical protein GF416_07400 [Candidatus Altiarchaeales archaeon]|nr:hypothetical protein [Candidatus Altiarchaeales archaeon]MBD3416938.1 hypothetical protein [Candidatus Altiarchaeales archaeon]
MLETVLLTVFGMVVLVLIINVPFWARKHSLYNRRDRFECKLCGNCCRFRVTPLTGEDVRRLEEAGLGDGVDRDRMSTGRVNGRCVFLVDDRCTAYEHRPQVCRDFPFFTLYGLGYAERAPFCPALEELEDG